MTIEQLAMILIPVLGAWVWNDLLRRIKSLEADKKDNNALTQAVTRLTVQVENLEKRIDELIVIRRESPGE